MYSTKCAQIPTDIECILVTNMYFNATCDYDNESTEFYFN